MIQKPLLIHFHQHHRRTGVTSSIENVLPILNKYFETYVFGNQVTWPNYLSYRELKKKIRSYDQVIIHTHRNKELQRALWLRLLGYKFKLVTSRHAATNPSKFTLWLMKKADVKIGLIDSMNQLPFEVSIIGHGVNTTRFAPNEKAQLNEIKQSNLIVTAGRVRPKKGHDTLIKATLPILKSNIDWALVIAGKIDDQNFVNQLKDQIKESQLSNQVYFLSETPKIELLYQASKITVVPSHTEGFSLVCLEAMACESITVATKDVGVHSKVIDNGKTGFLFEAGNHKQLHSILTELVNNNHRVDTEKARTFIKSYWSAQVEAEALKELYLNLVS